MKNMKEMSTTRQRLCSSDSIYKRRQAIFQDFKTIFKIFLMENVDVHPPDLINFNYSRQRERNF